MKKLINETINHLIITKEELNNDINDVLYADIKTKNLDFKDYQIINEKRRKISDIYDLIEKLEEFKKEI